MVTKRVTSGGGSSPFGIDPNSLPDDGSPVTFEQTFAKRLGPSGAQQQSLSEEDYKRGEWLVEKLTDEGWTVIDTVQGQPYEGKIMADYGRGKYRTCPVQDGKPLRVGGLQKTITVGSPAQAMRESDSDDRAAPESSKAGADNMPQWMQLLLQQQADERAEARREQREQAKQREQWEREERLREQAKLDREERVREASATRDAEARREASERQQALILAGLELARGFAAPREPRETRRDDRVQELLLDHVLSRRDQPAQPVGGSLRDSLDMLVALDQVAQSRADRMPAPEREEEEDDMGKTMMKMLPMMLMGRGGLPAPQGEGTLDIEGMLAQALQNPDIIAKVALRNPDAIARAFSKAVKGNKALEDSVVRVLGEDDEG